MRRFVIFTNDGIDIVLIMKALGFVTPIDRIYVENLMGQVLTIPNCYNF